MRLQVFLVRLTGRREAGFTVGGHQPLQLRQGDRPGKQIALRMVAVQGLQKIALHRAFHPRDLPTSTFTLSPAGSSRSGMFPNTCHATRSRPNLPKSGQNIVPTAR